MFAEWDLPVRFAFLARDCRWEKFVKVFEDVDEECCGTSCEKSERGRNERSAYMSDDDLGLRSHFQPLGGGYLENLFKRVLSKSQQGGLLLPIDNANFVMYTSLFSSVDVESIKLKSATQ